MLNRNRKLGQAIIATLCLSGCSLRNLDDLSRRSAAAGASAGTSGRAATTSVGGEPSEAGTTARIGTPTEGGAIGQATAGSAGTVDTTPAAGGAELQGSGGSSGGVSGGVSGAAGAVATAGADNCGGPMIIGVGDPQPRASGLAMLTVPLTATGQGVRFNYQNYDGMGSYSLACETLNIVACAPGAIGGNLHIFLTTSRRVDSPLFDIPLSAITDGFHTISIPVPNANAASFDPTDILVIRIEVEAGGDYGKAWQTPATIVYIDSIKTSNGLFSDTFDASSDALKTSGVRTVTGATVTWQNSYAVSTTGSGGAGNAGAGG